MSTDCESADGGMSVSHTHTMLFSLEPVTVSVLEWKIAEVEYSATHSETECGAWALKSHS